MTSESNGAPSRGSQSHWSRKSLLVVTPTDGVSDSLIYAVEHEFPWLSVVLVQTPEGAGGALDHPASLILVDTIYLPDIDVWAGALTQAHPGSAIALMQDDGRAPVPIQHVLSSRLVRGVVPMNLKLDVWLSILRLILRGGDYFPPAMLQDPAAAVPMIEAGLSGRASDLDELDELTDREAQVLQLVARGLQNKVIASMLDLSEHTVKIHLHHIITKLGVHNRTEASAIFHSRRGEANGTGAGSETRVPPVYPG